MAQDKEAPPDEIPIHTWDDIPEHLFMRRFKVEGGWLYVYRDIVMAFVPSSGGPK